MSSSPDTSSGTWRSPTSNLTVDYKLDVMERIRLEAHEGFKRIAHGGVELGGVLYGKRAENSIQILDWRPIHCSHARGPGFRLSDEDHEQLQQDLAEARQEPELRGLEPLGWFHSHTRSGLSLTPEDIELHNRHFGQFWQVALLLRPTAEPATRALFFAKDESGELLSDPESEAMLIERRPLSLPPDLSAPPQFEERAGQRPSRRPARGDDEPRRTRAAPPTPSTELSDWLRGEPGSRRLDEPERGPWRRSLASADLRREEEVAPPRAAPERVPPQPDIPAPVPPALLAEPPRTRMRWGVLWVAVLVAAAMVGSAYYYRVVSTEAATGISLGVEDVEGQLRVHWNRGAPAILAAEEAELLVKDGSVNRQIKLNKEELRKASLTYARQSDDVLLRMV